MGFHTKEIAKGTYGDISKVKEEMVEAYDAVYQNQRLMLLIELSDMIGAIRGIGQKTKQFSMEDIFELVYFTVDKENRFGNLDFLNDEINNLETINAVEKPSIYRMKTANIVKGIDTILKNDFNNGITLKDLYEFSILRSQVAIEEEKEKSI